MKKITSSTSTQRTWRAATVIVTALLVVALASVLSGCKPEPKTDGEGGQFAGKIIGKDDRKGKLTVKDATTGEVKTFAPVGRGWQSCYRGSYWPDCRDVKGRRILDD